LRRRAYPARSTRTEISGGTRDEAWAEAAVYTATNPPAPGVAITVYRLRDDPVIHFGQVVAARRQLVHRARYSEGFGAASVEGFGA
jgi:hypothetical protein